MLLYKRSRVISFVRPLLRHIVKVGLTFDLLGLVIRLKKISTTAPGFASLTGNLSSPLFYSLHSFVKIQRYFLNLGSLLA
jgi:hypothetical protein